MGLGEERWWCWTREQGGRRGSLSTRGGQGLVDGRLETAHVLYRGTVCFYGLHVLVENRKDLIVEDLVLPDAVSHFLQGLHKNIHRAQRRHQSRHGYCNRLFSVLLCFF